MNLNKVLIIEDDKYIRNFLNLSLKSSGYDLIMATNGIEGLSFFSTYNPDIILLDLGLPDIDGLEIIKSIRLASDIPILVLSARGEEGEKIKALDFGADDFITKPFHMGELMARVRVAERKLDKQAIASVETFEMDYLLVDFSKRLVFVDQTVVHLTPIEYSLLCLLVKNKGKVLTHNYIKKEIWGYSDLSDSSSLRVFMTNLRRKIEKDKSTPRFIVTEVGVGYRFSDS